MAGSNPRRILISVDNSDACEQAVNWVMTNLYKQGDELDPNAYQQLIQKAEDFIAQRALRHIGNITPQPVVHIVKYEVDTDSIGNVICKKAEELDVVVAIMARHTKTKLQEFFLGSCTK
ncbi:hypothetical protein N2152v2_002914 [Parachlorella kessleri]